MLDELLLLAPPPRAALLGEVRVLRDLALMLPALHRPVTASARLSNASPVLVLPGYGAGDASTYPLRRHLARHGVACEGWGLGMNRAGLNLKHTLADLHPSWGAPLKQPYRGEGGVAYLCTRMVEHVARRAEALGQPLTLVGWSLGGTIAREVARDLPQAVNRVITMGSPIIGGPKYTAAARALRRMGLDLDWIEAQVAARDARPIQQPLTSIISRSDGIVGRAAAIDRISPRVRHIEVAASHLGLGFNPLVWRHVLEAISQPLDARA
ncbi:MAG: alpha/beta fold hydrolase [Pseudomonadota bacterium]